MAKDRLTLGIICLNLLLFTGGTLYIVREGRKVSREEDIHLSEQQAEQYANLIRKGSVLLKTSDGRVMYIAQAMRYFQDAIDLNPRDLNGYLILGRTYMKVGSYRDAILTFHSALNLFPADGTLYELLAECYLGLKDNGLAIPYARRSVKLYREAGDEPSARKAETLLSRLHAP